MTLSDELKIIDDKIKANQVQYNLNREAAKLSALSSGELDKYEYLTGEDLGYQPGIVEKAEFKYSPLGKVFNKVLDEKDKKEILLEKFKNIENKNEEQLKNDVNARILGDKYGKKSMDTATKTGIDAAKTPSERSVQNSRSRRIFNWKQNSSKKTSEGKSKSKEKEDQTNQIEEIYIPPKKRQRIIDTLR